MTKPLDTFEMRLRADLLATDKSDLAIAGCAEAVYALCAEVDRLRGTIDELAPQSVRMATALSFIEEFIAVGGNGEGWTLDDMFDTARWALGHELEPRVLHKLRLILGDPLPGEEQP